MSAPKKILLVHISGRIGDSLLATPALNAVINKFPNFEITLYGHKNTISLFMHTPHVKKILPFSNKKAKWSGYLSKNSYDLVVIFSFFEPTLDIVKYSLRVSSNVVGFDFGDSDIYKNLKLSLPVPKNPHLMLPYLNLVSLLKCNISNQRIKFYLLSSEKAWAKNFLLNFSIHPDKFIIGVKIFSLPSRSWRDWTIRNFSLLAKKIIKFNSRVHFLLYGSSTENDNLEKLSSCIGENYSSVLTNLTLRQIASVMSQTQLYIGVDTGLTHLMSAFDIPMVCLYHGISPSYKAGPLNHPNFISIDHPLGENCTQGDSLDVISAEKVFEEIKRFL